VQPLLVVEVAGAGLVVVVVDEEARVTDVTSVDDAGAVVVLPGLPPPEHPTRVELITISSYQNVLLSPPYDSQPK
jgi:hypothetical protein